MTSCDSKFHNVIMCCVKKYFLLSALDMAPEHFSPCSFALMLWGIGEKTFQVCTRPLWPLQTSLSSLAPRFCSSRLESLHFSSLSSSCSVGFYPTTSTVFTTLLQVSSHFIITFFWTEITEVGLGHSWRCKFILLREGQLKSFIFSSQTDVVQCLLQHRIFALMEIHMQLSSNTLI